MGCQPLHRYILAWDGDPGHADAAVNAAAFRQMEEGDFSLPHPLEVELAELLCELIPCAEMVRFGKNGSDATAAAVRAARGFTGRDKVARCGYHGWQDWYIGSTSRHLGVPQAVRDLTLAFPYNNLPALHCSLSTERGRDRRRDHGACILRRAATGLLRGCSGTVPRKWRLACVR